MERRHRVEFRSLPIPAAKVSRRGVQRRRGRMRSVQQQRGLGRGPWFTRCRSVAAMAGRQHRGGICVHFSNRCGTVATCQGCARCSAVCPEAARTSSRSVSFFRVPSSALTCIRETLYCGCPQSHSFSQTGQPTSPSSPSRRLGTWCHSTSRNEPSHFSVVG